MPRRRPYFHSNAQGSNLGHTYRGRQPFRRHKSYRGFQGQPSIQETQGSLPRAQKLFHLVGQWIRRLHGHNPGDMESDAMVTGGAGLGLGALLNGMDWENVRTDVERESRAHVLIVGAQDAGKTTLVYRLKGLEEGAIELGEFQNAVQDAEPLQEDQPERNLQNFGFFAVLDVAPSKPPSAAGNGYFESDGVRTELENADLIVWVLDSTRGLRAWEYEWLARLRGTGKPLLVVANKMDKLNRTDSIGRWQQTLGIEILPISAHEGTNVMTHLVPQMVDAIPTLTTALGREVVAWRRDASQRVMRRAATLSGLVGLEPVPLLDLPFQISIQIQMVLRLAAIYGQPLRDQYSREMLATMVSAVGIRFAGGQLVKAIPLVGWIVSGALAAGGTWIIGRIALEYFENGRKVRIPLLSRDKMDKENREPEKQGADWSSGGSHESGQGRFRGSVRRLFARLGRANTRAR